MRVAILSKGRVYTEIRLPRLRVNEFY
jgi:hypothetical protein